MCLRVQCFNSSLSSLISDTLESSLLSRLAKRITITSGSRRALVKFCNLRTSIQLRFINLRFATVPLLMETELLARWVSFPHLKEEGQHAAGGFGSPVQKG